jgi:hypothetical protein
MVILETVTQISCYVLMRAIEERVLGRNVCIGVYICGSIDQK